MNEIKLYINEQLDSQANYVEGFPLSAFLATTSLSQVQPSDSVELVLGTSGTYLLTEALHFNCNWAIVGEQGATIVIQFTENSSTMHGGDYYIGCIYSNNNRFSASIRDVCIEFGNHHFPLGNDWARICLKIDCADSVTIENVNIDVHYNRVTNVRLRDCSNVILDGCKLINEHAAKTSDTDDNKAGGNLWVMGNCSNVTIQNCEFYKKGNDEALGFYHVGDLNAEYETHRDILVQNNLFVYGKLENEAGPSEAINPCDSLITIQSPDKYKVTINNDDIEKDYPPVFFDNIVFENNHFVISDLVKNLLWVMINHKNSQLRGLNVRNNFIEFENFSSGHGTFSYSINGYPSAIFNIYAASHSQQVEVVLDGNRIRSQCSISYGSSNSPGFRFISQSGGKVIAKGNYITILDVDDTSSNDSNNPNRILLLYRHRLSGMTDFIGNRVNGLYLTGSISSSESSDVDSRIGNAEINLIGNHLSGNTRCYVKRVDALNVNMHHNVINSIHYLFGFQNFGSQGTLRFTENEVRVVSSLDPRLYYSWDTAPVPYHINRLYSIDNKIYDSSTPIETGIPANEETIVSGNQYISTNNQ